MEVLKRQPKLCPLLTVQREQPMLFSSGRFSQCRWCGLVNPSTDTARVGGQARWTKVHTKDYKSPQRSRKAASIATWSVPQSDRYAEP